MTTRRGFAAWPLAAAVCAGLARTGSAQPSLVVVERGDLPLVLTVPHDGTEPIPGVAPRRGGTTVRDVGTYPLAAATVEALQRRLGRRPDLVAARFSRRYADANRAEDEALESEAAQPVYRAYHGAVRAAVDSARERFPGGALLLDIHGQGQVPATVFRGTRAGLTVRRLLDRHGPQALQGEHSLLGRLASAGLAVHPATGTPSLREDPRFTGGHTVAAYGSHQPGGIDAIQLEFGRGLREDPRTPRLLADALADFLQRWGYLPA